MEQLSTKKCIPCEGIGKVLTAQEINDFLNKVPGWQQISDHKAISKDFVMKNFMAAIRFVNNIAKVAEEENHHPDIHLSGYRKLRVELSTHALGGLTQNDFILAAKINELPAELKAN